MSMGQLVAGGDGEDKGGGGRLGGDDMRKDDADG